MLTGTRAAWGGKEIPGPLVVARIPVIVPVCVVKSVSGASVLKRAHSVSVMACMSKIACVSACMKMDDGPVQTGDGNGKPKRPRREILVTASVPRDAAYEARSAFRERPSRLRGVISARERPRFGKDRRANS